MAEKTLPGYREFPQPEMDGSDAQAVLAAWQRHLIGNADRYRQRLDLCDLAKAASALAAVQLKIDSGSGDSEENAEFMLKLAASIQQARDGAKEDGGKLPPPLGSAPPLGGEQ
jgi:hypothetical protein